MLRASRKLAQHCSGNKRLPAGELGDAAQYIKYSRHGLGTTYTYRQRYPTMIKMTTDSAMGDFMYNRFVKDWAADVPSYTYIWSALGAATAGVTMMWRHGAFNPDVTFRKQEAKLPLADRHRQWAYSLPYFHHRLRNWVNKFVWILMWNEPDFKDKSYSGLRPDRIQCHRRPHYWSIFSWTITYVYPEEDPMFTSCSHKNMCKIYHDMGYKKTPEMFETEEEE